MRRIRDLSHVRCINLLKSEVGEKKKDEECTQKDRELDKYVIKVNYD